MPQMLCKRLELNASNALQKTGIKCLKCSAKDWNFNGGCIRVDIFV
jgi:hypothetical protein